MKKVFLGLYHILRWSIVFILIFTALSTVLFQILFNPNGLPDSMVRRLQKEAAVHGIFFSAEQVTLNAIEGLTISDLSVFSDPQRSELFCTVETAQLQTNLLRLLFSEQKFEQIIIHSGTLRTQIPAIEKAGWSSTLFTGINFIVQRNENDLVIRNGSIKAPKLHTTFSGTVKDLFLRKPQREKPEPPTTPQFEPLPTNSLPLYLTSELNQLLAPYQNYLEQIHQYTQFLHFDKVPELNLRLVPPRDVNQGHQLQADFSLSDLNYKGLQIPTLKITAQLDKDYVKFSPISLKVDEEEFADFRITYAPKAKRLEAVGEIEIHPARILRLLPNLDLAKQLNELFDFRGEAPSVRFKIPEFTVTDLNSLEIESDIKVSNIMFRTLNILQGSAHLTYHNHALRFNQLTVDTPFNSGQLNGLYHIEKNYLILMGQQTGDPIHHAVFMGPNSSQSYINFWDDFSWKADSPPQIDFGFKANFNPPYNFNLFGSIQANNFFRLKQPVEQLSGQVNLHLNDSDMDLIISDLQAKLPKEQTVFGNVCYTVREDKQTEQTTENSVAFQLRGTTDPTPVLALVPVTAITDTLKPYKISPKTQLEATGYVDLLNGDNTQVDLTFDTEAFAYSHYILNDFKGTLTYKNNELTIPAYTANFFDGPAEGSFNINLDDSTGAAVFIAKDLQLATIPDLEGKARGNGSIELDTNFKMGNDQFLHQGIFKLSITEGDFWKVPVITSLSNVLSNILPTKSVGEITKVDAECELTNEAVKVTKLVTDGSVIALEGTGRIDYINEVVAMEFEIKPLSGVLWKIIPKLMSPITKTMKIKLDGPYDNLKWSVW